jgi:hypothetical protein
VTYLEVKRGRLIIALLTAPALGPLIFVLLQVYWFGTPKGPMPFLETAAVVWAISGWPSYVGAVVLGVPLALTYLRFGITSWLAYWGGGLLCAFVTATCLILAGNREGFLTHLNGFSFFIVLYGLMGGSCVRATFFGFTTSKQVRLAVGSPTETPRHRNEALAKLKGIGPILLLAIVPPIPPLVWLFTDSHPYGIPSGPEGAIASVLTFAASFVAPAYMGTLLFGVPLALLYRCFRLKSWLPCVAGGLANGLVAVVLLRAMGQTVDILMKPAEALAFIASYGALSAIALRISVDRFCIP